MRHGISWLISIGLCVLPAAHAGSITLQHVYHPVSLIGTDGDADPLQLGQSWNADIVRRPVFLGSSNGEVYAMLLPHKIAGLHPDLPDESNLLVLIGAKLEESDEGRQRKIIADFSQATVPDHLSVTLWQALQLTAVSLQKTFDEEAHTPILVEWRLPPNSHIEATSLPGEIRYQEPIRFRLPTKASPPGKGTWERH